VFLFLFFREKKRIIRQAKKWLDVDEVGNNYSFTDPEFYQKIKAVGWQPSLQWCSFFAKLVLLETHKGEKKEVLRQIMSGSSQQTFKNFIANDAKYKWFTVSDRPKKAGLAVWQSVSKPAFGHIAIVKKVRKNSFDTIEGNFEQGVNISNHFYDEYNKKSGNRLIGFVNF